MIQYEMSISSHFILDSVKLLCKHEYMTKGDWSNNITKGLGREIFVSTYNAEVQCLSVHFFQFQPWVASHMSTISGRHKLVHFEQYQQMSEQTYVDRVIASTCMLNHAFWVVVTSIRNY